MPRPNHRRGSSPSESEPILHSGVLFKRGYGATPIIGRKSWKPRHFELTQTTLRYYTFENGKLRDEIDLRKCHTDSLEIMPSDARKTGRSKSSIWRLALNVPQGRRVLMAAPTEREMNAWIKHIGGVLYGLHATKTLPTEAPLSNSKLDNQLAHEQEEKEEDEDGIILLEQVTSRHSDGLDGLVAGSWKNNVTTDFQNFVAQPRRSMIFRRHSFEGKPIVPGVYRNSTGQIDDRELATELEELRREYVAFHSDGEVDDDMTEEEEDALLRALRAFSVVHSERNDVDPAEEDQEYGNQREDSEVLSSTSPVKPIFHFKKEPTPPPTPREQSSHPVRTTEDAKWFSNFSGKFHRKSKRGTNQNIENDRVAAFACSPPATVGEELAHDDDDDEVPAHLKEDPATSKPRRYSTGSMLLASERHTINPERDSEAEREEALIQELLAGLVHSHYDENSVSPHRDSSEGATNPRPSESSDGSHTTHSSGQETPSTSSGSPGAAERLPLAYSDMIELLPASAPLIPTTCQRACPRGDEKDRHGDRWFKRLKSKWRSRQDDEKSPTPKKMLEEAEVGEWPGSVTEVTPAAAMGNGDVVKMESPREDDNSIDGEVVSVLSDMVANVALLGYAPTTPQASEVFLTSPNSTTARARPQLAASSVRARETMTESRVDREPRQKKRGFFRRWSDKLRSNGETRSRRHSTGDMIPETAVPGAHQSTSARAAESNEQVPTGDEIKPVVDGQLEEARHFGVKLSCNTKEAQGLIELLEINGIVDASEAFGSTEAADADDSEEEIVVVVVRRRHSTDKSVSMPSQKRVTFRVFVDVGEDKAQGCSSAIANCEEPQSLHSHSTKVNAPASGSEFVPRVPPVVQQSPPVCAV